MKYEEYLAHFNPNHDRLGRFAKNNSSKSKKHIKGPPAALVGAVSAAGMTLAADDLLRQYGSKKASKTLMEQIFRVGGAASVGALVASGVNVLAKKKLDNNDNQRYNAKRNEDLKKEVAAGVALATASLMVVGGVYLYGSGRLDKYIKSGRELLNKSNISDVEI